MKKNFETAFTGWAFIMGALLLWSGWFLTNHHLGEYIKAEDFVAINEDVWYWIWMYRIHIFGWVGMGVALLGLVSITSKNEFRTILVAGAGVAIIGTFTYAIGTAFYYNFGAWGVGKTIGKSPEEVQAFMDSILPVNQYVTCLIRFGRVFSGVGLVILGAGFVKSGIFNKWVGIFTILLGLAAVGIIMLIPLNFEIYKPLFHIKVIWLILMGVLIIKNGVSEKGNA